MKETNSEHGKGFYCSRFNITTKQTLVVLSDPFDCQANRRPQHMLAKTRMGSSMSGIELKADPFIFLIPQLAAQLEHCNSCLYPLNHTFTH